jgi:hypothetical protein
VNEDFEEAIEAANNNDDVTVSMIHVVPPLPPCLFSYSLILMKSLSVLCISFLQRLLLACFPLTPQL